MRIYIDEAGNFVSQASGQSLFSLVLAFVVPSLIETKLIDEFSSLISSWPHTEAEIKGSKLDESQAARLIDLVSRYDVLVNFFAVDMATHGESVVSDFKARQATGITANLTPEHDPPIVAQLQELVAAIRRMPNQLFLQAFLMIELVLKVIEEGTLYYVQRLPTELGSIAWIIDRKNRTVTEKVKVPSNVCLFGRQWKRETVSISLCRSAKTMRGFQVCSPCSHWFSSSPYPHLLSNQRSPSSTVA